MGRTIQDAERINEKVRALARRVVEHPDDPEIEQELSELCTMHGSWIRDQFIDYLTADDPTSYPQSLQDKLRSSNRTVSPELAGISGRNRIPILSLDAIDGGNQYVVSDVLGTIIQLVLADYHRLRAEARLSGIEWDVWYYWLRGYQVAKMATWLCKPDGQLYRPNSVRKILYRVWDKVQKTPYLAIVTCRAEDQTRGKHANPPTYVSWSEITDL